MNKKTRKTLVCTLVSLLGAMPIANVEAPAMNMYANHHKPSVSETKNKDLIRGALAEDIKMQINQEEKAMNSAFKRMQLSERDRIYGYILQVYSDINVPEYITKKFVRAQIWAESWDTPNAIGKDGERGLMQIMPGTWKKLEPKLSFEKNAFNPKYNVRAGVKHLISTDRQLKARNSKWEVLNEEEKRKLLAATYNCGLGGVIKANYNIKKVPETTKRYIRNIERLMSEKYEEY